MTVSKNTHLPSSQTVPSPRRMSAGNCSFICSHPTYAWSSSSQVVSLQDPYGCGFRPQSLRNFDGYICYLLHQILELGELKKKIGSLKINHYFTTSNIWKQKQLFLTKEVIRRGYCLAFSLMIDVLFSRRRLGPVSAASGCRFGWDNGKANQPPHTCNYEREEIIVDIPKLYKCLTHLDS